MPDLLIALIAGLISAAVALLVAKVVDRAAEGRWRDDRRLTDQQRREDREVERRHKRAEWIREAAADALRAAEEWRHRLSTAAGDVTELKVEWQESNARADELNNRIAGLASAVSNAEQASAKHIEVEGVESQALAFAVANAANELRDAQTKSEQLRRSVDAAAATISTQTMQVVGDSHTRWVQAKALSEILAPELRYSLTKCEAALSTLEGAVVNPASSIAREMQQASMVFAEMLTDAREAVEKLLRDEVTVP